MLYSLVKSKAVSFNVKNLDAKQVYGKFIYTSKEKGKSGTQSLECITALKGAGQVQCLVSAPTPLCPGGWGESLAVGEGVHRPRKLRKVHLHWRPLATGCRVARSSPALPDSTHDHLGRGRSALLRAEVQIQFQAARNQILEWHCVLEQIKKFH